MVATLLLILLRDSVFFNEREKEALILVLIWEPKILLRL